MPRYPTNKSSSVTQNIETYTSKPHVIPHKSCVNVLVLEQIKHMNSRLSKVSNKTSKILSSDHVFKILSLLMKSNHNFKINKNFTTTGTYIFLLKNGAKCM